MGSRPCGVGTHPSLDCEVPLEPSELVLQASETLLELTHFSTVFLARKRALERATMTAFRLQPSDRARPASARCNRGGIRTNTRPVYT